LVSKFRPLVELAPYRRHDGLWSKLSDSAERIRLNNAPERVNVRFYRAGLELRTGGFPLRAVVPSARGAPISQTQRVRCGLRSRRRESTKVIMEPRSPIDK
jgi:hypothetical protein